MQPTEMEIFSSIIAVVSSIISGVFLYLYKKQQEKSEEKEEDKAKYEYCCSKSLNALFSITKELYNCCMLGRTPNGELEEAFKYMQKSKHELEDHLRERATKN